MAFEPVCVGFNTVLLVSQGGAGGAADLNGENDLLVILFKCIMIKLLLMPVEISETGPGADQSAHSHGLFLNCI